MKIPVKIRHVYQETRQLRFLTAANPGILQLCDALRDVTAMAMEWEHNAGCHAWYNPQEKCTSGDCGQDWQAAADAALSEEVK